MYAQTHGASCANERSRTFEGVRIALVANTDWYLFNFRADLIGGLREHGMDVHCIAPRGDYFGRLQGLGVHVHEWQLGETSLSAMANLRALRKLAGIYTSLHPALLHHFTPRCVVLGSIAAGRAEVPHVVNALTGLGHLFTGDSLSVRAARSVVRRLLLRYLGGPGRAVIFQNEEDRDELLAAGLVDSGACHVIRGSGVDPAKFRPSASVHAGNEVRVLFASRLLRDKGIGEMAEAMHRVVDGIPSARLWIAGRGYPQNPTSLNRDELEALERLPFVKLLGHRDDMPALLADVDIVALPSYREGTPKILLEAAACGLPIVATDIPGCRGVVENGVNGFLVPPRDTATLADALEKLCQDSALRKAMGQRGREIIVSAFTSDRVIEKTLAIYRSLLSRPVKPDESKARINRSGPP